MRDAKENDQEMLKIEETQEMNLVSRSKWQPPGGSISPRIDKGPEKNDLIKLKDEFVESSLEVEDLSNNEM